MYTLRKKLKAAWLHTSPGLRGLDGDQVCPGHVTEDHLGELFISRLDHVVADLANKMTALLAFSTAFIVVKFGFFNVSRKRGEVVLAKR